ncbi:MAG: hypothetical protein F6J90_22800 [Moorea sp. SIOASIH]|nr:hypothetical protein [Moorena sp. SIOASIH]NEO39011.1 hypothetical protein [Moorena sp. SIOASIH]
MKELSIRLISVPWPFGHATRTPERGIHSLWQSVELVSRIACFKLTADG